MRKDFNIFVEGVADARFFKQYINHVFGEKIPDERIVVLKGWDNLKTEASYAFNDSKWWREPCYR